MKFALLSKAFFITLYSISASQAAIPSQGGASEPWVRIRFKTDQNELRHAYREMKVQSNWVRTPGVAKISCRGNLVYVSHLGNSTTPVSTQFVELIQGAGAIEKRFRVTSSKGKCNEILSLSMEEYLVGVVSKEMVPTWPKESLRAQAIASRTYALYQMKSRSRADYDLESTVMDQVYEFPERVNPQVRDAVARTRGEILGLNQSGHLTPIKSFFHSTCGGHTELPELVWGKKFSGLKRTTKCPYCHESPRKSWKESFTHSELQKKLGKNGSTLVDLNILPRYASSRHSGVSMSWKSQLKNKSQAWVELIPLDLFRHKVGTEKVRSNWFRLTKTAQAGETTYVFDGQGFGHGVGLCQWGARGMALQGKNYREILRHYYKDAHLGKLW